MENLKRLIEFDRQHDSPSAKLGEFLLTLSNSPEFLAAHLERYRQACSADLEANKALMASLHNLLSVEQTGVEQTGVRKERKCDEWFGICGCDFYDHADERP